MKPSRSLFPESLASLARDRRLLASCQRALLIWLLLYILGQLLWPRYQAQAHVKILNLEKFYSKEESFELAKSYFNRTELIRIQMPTEELAKLSLKIRPSNQGLYLQAISDTPRAALSACRKCLDQVLLRQADQGAELIDDCQKNYTSQRTPSVELLTISEKKISRLTPDETRRYLVSIIDHRELTYQHSIQMRQLAMQMPLLVVLDQPHNRGRVYWPGWTSGVTALLASLIWSASLSAYRRVRY